MLDILIDTLVIGMISIIIYILYTNEWVQMTIGLIVLFINAGLVFLILGLEYLGLIYLVVYIGAICVLFLFVIILLNLRSMDKSNYEGTYGLLLVGLTLAILSVQYNMIKEDNGENIVAEGVGMFNENIINIFVYYIEKNIYLFLLLIILMLIGIMMPIMLSKDIITVNYAKKHEIIFTKIKKYKKLLKVRDIVK